MLHSAVHKQYVALSPANKLLIQEGLQSMAGRLGGVLSVATGCSGTDVLLHVLDILAKHWLTVLGVRVAIRHVFSTESVSWKQEFIKMHCRPEMLFSDIGELGGDACRDVLSGEMRPVPTCNVWGAGVECDTISALNRMCGASTGVVAAAVGKTGRTAQGCFAYIERRRPDVFFIENIKNLNSGAGPGKETDLDVIVRKANDLGYLVFPSLLNALDYGFPQHRERYYLVGFAVAPADSGLCQTEQDFVFPDWHRAVGMLLRDSRVEPLPLEAFLHDQDDSKAESAWAKVHQLKRQQQQREKGEPRKKQKENATWEVDHLQLFTEAGLQWPPVFDEDFIARAGHVVNRQQEIIYYFNQIYDTTERESFVDINMTISWAKRCVGHTGCIVSSSHMWRLKAGCSVEPTEALSLQGYSPGALNISFDSLEWDPPRAFDLAGNMFNGGVVAAVLSAALPMMPWGAEAASSKVVLEERSASTPGDYPESDNLEVECSLDVDSEGF